MNDFTPDQEIALCEREIEQWTRLRNEYQRTVRMFDDMIADAKRRIIDAQAQIGGCGCGWRPHVGVIGGETLKEHQAWCSAVA